MENDNIEALIALLLIGIIGFCMIFGPMLCVYGVAKLIEKIFLDKFMEKRGFHLNPRRGESYIYRNGYGTYSKAPNPRYMNDKGESLGLLIHEKKKRIKREIIQKIKDIFLIYK